MDQASIQQALVSWCRTALGLDPGRVAFSDQNSARLTGGPFVLLKLTAAGEVASELETLDADDPQPGAEIEQRVLDTTELVISVQVMGAPTVSESNMQLATKLRAALNLPGVIDTLEAGGMTWFDKGPVQNISAIVGVGFEGRAVFELRAYTMVTASEFTTWIEKVDILWLQGDLEITVDGVTVTIQGSRITYGAGPPSAGAHGEGDIVFNTSPVAGGNAGWVCVEAGTPGIWRQFGLISAVV